MSLDIRVNGQSLDLDAGASKKFYITKQMHDLRNLQTREANYTSTVRVPATVNNLNIVGTDSTVLAQHSDTAISFLPCQVLIDGLPIIDDAVLRVGVGDESGFDVTIYEGLATFYSALSNRSIRELFWSDHNIEWTLTGVETIVNNKFDPITQDFTLAPLGICYSNTIWITNDSYEEFVASGVVPLDNQEWPQLRQSGVWLYIRKVLDNILAEDNSGRTFDLSPLGENPLLNQLAIAVPIDSFFGEQETEAITGISSMQNFPLKANDQDFQSMPMLLEDEEGPITFTNGEWVMQETAIVDVAASLQVTSDSLDDWNITVHLMVNDESVRSAQFSTAILRGRPRPLSASLRLDETVMQAGDVISLGVSIDLITEANYSDSGGIDPARSIGTVTYREPRNINISRPKTQTASIIDFGAALPDVTQKEFVLTILKQFNIIMTEENQIVTFSYWDDIPKRAPIVAEYDKDHGFLEAAFLDQYARQNDCLYTNQNVASNQSDGQFNVWSSLKDKKTAIRSAFSSCDRSVVAGGSGRLQIPAYEISKDYVEAQSGNAITFIGSAYTTEEESDLKLNSLLVTPDGLFRVTNYLTNSTGSIDAGSGSATEYQIINFQRASNDRMHMAKMGDGTDDWEIVDGHVSRLITGTYQRATWASRQLNWNRVLLEFYPNLVNTLGSPYVFTAFFSLSVLAFIEIDQLRPLYIPSKGALFYINKISQFKTNNLVRIELIQIGVVSNQSISLNSFFVPPTVGEFSNAFSDAFNN